MWEMGAQLGYKQRQEKLPPLLPDRAVAVVTLLHPGTGNRSGTGCWQGWRPLQCQGDGRRNPIQEMQWVLEPGSTWGLRRCPQGPLWAVGLLGLLGCAGKEQGNAEKALGQPQLLL